MGWVSGIVVYLLLWWWVFLMALPLKVRRPEAVARGHDPAAPHKTHLWQKFIGATVLAFILWLGVDMFVASDIFSFRRLADGIE